MKVVKARRGIPGGSFDLDGSGVDTHEEADVEVDGERDEGVDVAPVSTCGG